MMHRYLIDVTAQRLQETEQAIAEQRRYVASLTDPVTQAIARRTLATLEDMLLIMRRTQGILADTRGDGAAQR